ncbi:MAG: DUF116 domain-containing protein [Candidatus Iainarchaeum archaeon]|uniref:DUF116 domain-containing protein n=1 Tax=Candidatus Iainarchaeum sp. TaxID=3101447 RepID=A0A497JKG9_9ARCH|nr:MAG: DUF116 domain-containing protein [Candidatus Diapherotrites archaeon]
MEKMMKIIKKTIYAWADKIGHQKPAELAKQIVKILGLNERWINYTHIEIRNFLHEPAFREVPVEERAFFLPHCLRNAEKCKGKYEEEGLKCGKCGACQVKEIIEYAEKLGYEKIFVVPGGSMVVKLVKKYKPKATIGIACFNELMMAMDKMNEYGIPNIGSLLLKDGCRNTVANVEDIKEKLALGLRK